MSVRVPLRCSWPCVRVAPPDLDGYALGKPSKIEEADSRPRPDLVLASG